MFKSLRSKLNTVPTVYLGAPEAEAETLSRSRVNLADVYRDYHNLLPQLDTEKFILVGRKGSGKSAFAEYLYLHSMNNANEFCKFIKRDQLAIERVVQHEDSDEESISYSTFIKWMVYTNFLDLIINNESVKNIKEYRYLVEFLKKNSGFVDIDKLEINEYINKHGYEVNVEALKRYFRAKGNKSFEMKQTKAPYYKLLKPLEGVLIEILSSKENMDNQNEVAIFFDDLDIDFSVKNDSSVKALLDLVRTCKGINKTFSDYNAKVIILLRDDVESYLSKSGADTAKLFNSFSARINWYQNDNGPSHVLEDDLNIKKFITTRIKYAFKKAGLSYNNKCPWDSLVSEEVGKGKTSFKYIMDFTLFRPRDLLLFFQPLENGNYTFPLDVQDITTLKNLYSSQLANELKNELSTFYTKSEIEMIFLALREISYRSCSYYEALKIIEDNCVEINAEALLEDLFERSVIGNNYTGHRYSFKYRQGIGPSAQVITFNKSVDVIVQYGISSYLYSYYKT